MPQRYLSKQLQEACQLLRQEMSRESEAVNALSILALDQFIHSQQLRMRLVNQLQKAEIVRIEPDEAYAHETVLMGRSFRP